MIWGDLSGGLIKDNFSTNRQHFMVFLSQTKYSESFNTGFKWKYVERSNTWSLKILKGLPGIQKVINSNVEYPYHWITKRAIWGHSDFLGWLSPVYRFCRLGPSKACLPFLACHCTILTRFLSIDFLWINKIELAEYFLLIGATSFRVWLFRFLRMPWTLHMYSLRCVSDKSRMQTLSQSLWRVA